MIKQPRTSLRRAVAGLISSVLYLSLLWPALAQQGGTVRYVYDSNGRLRAVITPNGDAAVYDYDPAGNFTAIRRLTAGDLEVLDFSPRQGPIGTQVTILGVGFDGTVSNVSFNGSTGRIVSQGPTSVVAEVPSVATTGPISVTSPRGTRTTTDSFIVSGVRVDPVAITLPSGASDTFTATVSGLPDSSVKWSVNGVEGGTSTVGFITAGGFYTAPDVTSTGPALTFTVRATSVVDSSLFGEAMVTVPSKGNGFQFLSTAISVRYGATPTLGPTFTQGAAVSVRYGPPPGDAPAYVSGPVSVRYGPPPSDAPAYIAGPVSVRYGPPPNTAPAYVSGPVSVIYGPPPNTAAAQTTTRVSATKGPVITSLSPAMVSRGATITLTVSGTNLSGATQIRFINLDGTLETNITASNINVNAGGTSLTATVTVNANTTLGRRIVYITAAAGQTLLADDGINIITVQ